MQVKLPSVWALNIKQRGFGYIRQLLLPDWYALCTAVPYTRDKDRGYLLQGEAGQTLAYLLPRKPKANAFQQGEPVLVATYESVNVHELDLSRGYWLHHPLLSDATPAARQLADAARDSWRDAFYFVEENEAHGVIGLRRPQLGALHAIHAHWCTSKETATVVMPTGTGKTETMLSTLTSAICHRVLVIVPTDALRTQLAGKFETLGFLKHTDSALLVRQHVNYET